MNELHDTQAIAARLTAIAERLKAATQGEWYVEHPQVYYKIRVAETRAYILEQNYGGIRDEADADLIANAPADLRFLLAHVETLEQQVAQEREEFKQRCETMNALLQPLRAEVNQAEQQRDAAHAALEKARFEIQQLEIVVPAHLEGDELFNRNGDYIYRENVLELVDAALAASAPQKESTACRNGYCAACTWDQCNHSCHPKPAPAQETER